MIVPFAEAGRSKERPESILCHLVGRGGISAWTSWILEHARKTNKSRVQSRTIEGYRVFPADIFTDSLRILLSAHVVETRRQLVL